MPVNTEIKGQLAKLLATEDLVVENRKVQTAQFNVDTRVLTLPMWERASNVVYDLLVGHEVGHALFTPNIDPPKNIPHQFLNVAEDVRIEKLMKRKYPGLAKTFYVGYKELDGEDFFGIGDEDLSKLNIADRINLHFKIGNFTEVPFNGVEEASIIKMLNDAETFDDVIAAAEKMYRYAKSQQEQQQKPEQVDVPQTDTSGDSNTPSNQTELPQQSESEGNDDEESEQQESESTSESETTDTDQGSTSSDPMEVKTADNFSQQTESLNEKHSYGGDPKYLEIPDVDLNTAIVKNSEIYDHINEFYEQFAVKLSQEGVVMNVYTANFAGSTYTRTFNIKRVINVETKNKYTELLCVEGVAT